ncbi:CoxG family protein [Alkalibacillus haloalkaliphilus]|uniref:CoxG family protein n=1 Tax=Alkalibacillus haloalkaliphilus TaxID=94136 RepID=UPI0002D810D7|nr:SRPBCC family protein [Alkalibacillus haloalkaliphilus]
MPSGTHRVEVNVPIDVVWEFVSQMDNWAPLVPGYMHHEIINDRNSTWTFKGEVGKMYKTVSLKVEIQEWIEPEKVTFKLIGINENVIGHGYFQARKLMDTSTQISGSLDVTAKGMKGPVINSVLKSLLPQTSQRLTTAVSDRICEMSVAK